MLVISWRRWMSPIVDSGREVDLPLRLLEGDLLYRDVFYMYPPLSPYFNSLLYSIFGVRFEVLQVSGVLISAFIVFICYRIARRLLTSADACIAIVAIIAWCVFKPSGNLISPYSYSALHGTVFALSALLFLLRFSESRSFRQLVVAGVLSGLAGLSKQEFGLAAAMTGVGTIGWLTLGQKQNARALLRQMSAFLLPFLAIVTPVFWLLLYRFGWDLMVRDCHVFLTHLPASLVFYNSQRTGLNRPFASVLELIGGGVVCAAIAAAIALFSSVLARLRGFEIRETLIRNALIFCAVSAVSIFAILAFTSAWDGGPLRGLPLVLLVIIVNEVRKRAGAHTSLLIIALYSLIVLGRVVLRVPSGGAFGSFFLPTSLIILTYSLLEFLPCAISRWSGVQQAGRYVVRTARVLLVTFLVVGVVVFGVRYRRGFNFLISASRGVFYAPASVGPAYQETISYLTNNSSPADKVAVFPEGSDLAFLSGRRNPLRHQNLHPLMMDDAGETRAIEQLSSEPVRFVVITNRPMREFGAEAFGRDYYTRLGEAIEREYRLVRICGNVSEHEAMIGARRFFTRIYERR